MTLVGDSMKFESYRDKKTHISFFLQLILTIALGVFYFFISQEMIILTSFVILALIIEVLSPLI